MREQMGEEIHKEREREADDTSHYFDTWPFVVGTVTIILRNCSFNKLLKNS